MRRRELLATTLTGLAAGAAGVARAQGMPHGLLPGRLFAGQEIVVVLPPSNQYRGIAKRLPEFRQLTGISVRFVFADFNRMLDQLRTELRGRAASFDVANIADTWLPFLVDDLMPLDELMRNDGLDLRRYPPAYRAGAMFLGRSFAVPIRGYGQLLFYRKDAFERARLQPPATWEDLIRASWRLQQSPGLPGLALAMGYRPDHSNLHVWLNFMWARGGEIFSDRWTPRFNEQLVIEATQIFAELNLRHEILAPGSGNFAEEQALVAFAQGRAAMTVGWEWNLPSLVAPVGTLRRQQIGIAPMPRFGQRPAVTYGRSLSMIPNPHSARRDAAWEFIKWMSNPELEIAVATDKSAPETSEGMVVHLENFRNEAINKANGDIPRASGGSLEYSRILPQIRDWRPVADVLSQAVADVGTGVRLARPALDDAARHVERIMRQAGMIQD
ncbi:MAG: extracellular solute-binding protein [Alphaproteobacteria bacterium]|nr:extracellular solute-binding protein [Alphaproteobacteria bacterium]